MTKSHEDHGKIVHRPYSSCISSVGNLTGTPSSSPCQLKPGGWLSHLGLSHYTQVEGQKKIPPKLVIIKGEEEFEVEKILNKRMIRGKKKFLVR